MGWWVHLITNKIVRLLVTLLLILPFVNNYSLAANDELSLKEAINLGFQRAKEWSPNASLTRVNSVDETMGGSRGENGKRFNWFTNFMVPGTDEHLLIGISKRKITVYKPIKQSSQDPTIPSNEINFDSSDVLKLAKDKFGLKQGKDWATGYHFTLDRIDGKPVITVVGNVQNNLFARVSFNAKTGEILGAIHKVPFGGGLISHPLGSNSSKLTKQGMAVMGITAGKGFLVTWGDKKPTQFSTSKKPYLELSKNTGETWTELGMKKAVNQAWFNNQEELFVATATEVWANAKKLLSVEKNIENIDYSLTNNIALLSDDKIYSTLNQGRNWQKIAVPKELFKIQISDEGTLFVLTQDRKILQKTNDSWKEIPTNSSDVPNDMKVIKNKLFITTRSGLWVRELKATNWTKIDVDEELTRLIKKGEKLFWITHRGTAIYSISGKPKKVYDAKDVIVWDVDSIKDTLWISTIPDYSWEEMEPVKN